MARSQKQDKWALRVCSEVALWKYKAIAIVQYAYLGESKVTENVQRSMKLCILVQSGHPCGLPADEKPQRSPLLFPFCSLDLMGRSAPSSELASCKVTLLVQAHTRRAASKRI